MDHSNFFLAVPGQGGCCHAHSTEWKREVREFFPVGELLPESASPDPGLALMSSTGLQVHKSRAHAPHFLITRARISPLQGLGFPCSQLRGTQGQRQRLLIPSGSLLSHTNRFQVWLLRADTVAPFSKTTTSIHGEREDDTVAEGARTVASGMLRDFFGPY